MERFYQAGSENKPEINFDPSNCILEVSGRSYHEDVIEVYGPAWEWLMDFLKNSSQQIEFHFKLLYYNTATARILHKFFHALDDYVNDGKEDEEVKIMWFYPDIDEDLLEYGEEFEDENQNLLFTFIPEEY